MLTDAYDVILYVAAALFFVASALIGWRIVRDRGDPDAPGAVRTPRRLALELTWWAIPTLLMIVLFIVSAGALVRR